MPFKTFDLPPAMLSTLAEQNYKTIYPIQEAAIPAILSKKDLLGIAQTGSGKTASYVLPILCNLQGTGRPKNRQIKALVIVPTRELAIQVGEVFQLFSENLPERIKTLAVFGGVSINPQMMAMQGVHILVATPGRLLDLIDSNAVKLSDVSTLVLDEADKMLNLGFKEEMSRILAVLPEKRQNLLFSATLSKDLSNITDVLLHNPEVVKIEQDTETEERINQTAYLVSEEKKGPLLRYLIKHNNLQQVLVFTSSIYQANNVADKLRKNGIQAAAIHSKKGQTTRRESLQQFKAGTLQVLVTTDLLARGIDIEFLPHVINYELPRSPKDYIHRIGRTGRAESSGEAISFISAGDLHHFKVIQKKMGTWAKRIDSEDINLHGY